MPYGKASLCAPRHTCKMVAAHRPWRSPAADAWGQYLPAVERLQKNRLKLHAKLPVTQPLHDALYFQFRNSKITSFGVQKCGPWYICALSSSSPWRTLTFFHLEEESSCLVAWETKCTALYYLNVKRSWMFFCKKPIYATLNSPGSQFYRLGSSFSLESSLEN